MSASVKNAMLLAGASLLAISGGAARAAVPATPAAASAPDEPAGADQPTDQLGDIIVTGEKRETPLQSAPLAITAIGGRGCCKQRNLNQLNDLNGYVPGL